MDISVSERIGNLFSNSHQNAQLQLYLKNDRQLWHWRRQILDFLCLICSHISCKAVHFGEACINQDALITSDHIRQYYKVQQLWLTNSMMATKCSLIQVFSHIQLIILLQSLQINQNLFHLKLHERIRNPPNYQLVQPFFLFLPIFQDQS